VRNNSDLRGDSKARAYKELQGHCEAILDASPTDCGNGNNSSTCPSCLRSFFGPLYRVIEPGVLFALDRTRDLLDVSTSLSVAESGLPPPLK